MRNITLYEGGKPRKLPSVAQMETDPQGNGERVLWVPAIDYLGMDKHISENGTYKVEDEVGQDGRGFWAYQKVTVNVYGGAAGKEREDTGTEDWDTEDPSDPQEPDAKGAKTEQEVEPAGTIDPETGRVREGAITGKDPETGKVKTIRAREVTDPETGKKKSVLEESPVPVAIRVSVPPDKITYSDGEKIDYSGIQVILYEEYEETTEGGEISVNAKPFKDSQYPDSKIPFDELVFPITSAGGGADDGEHSIDAGQHIHVGNIDIGGPIEYVEDTLMSNYFGISTALALASGYVWANTDYNTSESKHDYRDSEFYGAGDLVIQFHSPSIDVPVRVTSVWLPNGSLVNIAAWKPVEGSATSIWRRVRQGLSGTYNSMRFTSTITLESASHGTSTVRYVVLGDENYNDYGWTMTSPRAVAENVPLQWPDPHAYNNIRYARIAWYLWNGSFKKDSVPVQWISPYNKRKLQDSFKINIIGDENA